MFTDSPGLLPARQLVHIMRHLGHLTPRPWPDRPRRAVIGVPQQGSYHPDQEQTASRTVSSQTGTEVLSGEEPGKVITRASCIRRPGELPVASKALAGN